MILSTTFDNTTFPTWHEPNQKHRKYQDAEKSINKQLNIIIAERRIGVRPADIYEAANISRTTFYAHCESCDDALEKYEKTLKIELVNALAPCKKTYSMFTILLVFIKRNSEYFDACFSAKDFYLVDQGISLIINKMNITDLDELSYRVHAGTVRSVLEHWQMQDYDPATMEQHIEIIIGAFEAGVKFL